MAVSSPGRTIVRMTDAHVITAAEARRLMADHLAAENPHAFISDDHTQHTDIGWVFFPAVVPNPAEINQHGLPPVLVDRWGRTTHLAYSKSVADWLDVYRSDRAPRR